MRKIRSLTRILFELGLDIIKHCLYKIETTLEEDESMVRVLKNRRPRELMCVSQKREGSTITRDGALSYTTGDHTGRSPDAKFIVYDKVSKDKVCWKNNNKITEGEFDNYYKKFLFFKNNAHKVYHQQVSAVRDPEYVLDIDVYTEFAKHSLFVRNMFVHADDQIRDFDGCYTIYHFPSIHDKPLVLISLEKRVILIAGTHYSGEIKKSVFTVLNYWFPESWGFLPMHCSVNVDKNRKNPAIFFGLSGTGKTTLSSDTLRILVGDDEHGWTDKGLVNFEGGCYAKTINLSKEDEPMIWDACHSHGATLENVVITDGIPDFNDARYTKNGRASYNTELIKNADSLGYVNEHPKNIVMLTCDAFGVLPPVAKLSPDEAVKQFLLGYTAKVAGTEQGVTEPMATFSPCFGLPFMPLPPKRYGDLLKEKIIKHDVNCWLVNTGWTGGSYGTGKRIPIKITRDIITNILNGNLATARYSKHEYTGLNIPLVHKSVIPYNILIPELGWYSLVEYKEKAKELMKKMNGS